MTIKWEGICSPVSVYYDKLGARWQSGSRIVGQGARGSNPPAAFRNMANFVHITLRGSFGRDTNMCWSLPSGNKKSCRGLSAPH